MFSAASVCLFVNTITSETSERRMMKHGGKVRCTKISAEFEYRGHSHPNGHPQKCGVGLRRWENQRRLSSGPYVC